MTVIREARPADAPGIATVHVESWRSAYAGLVPDPVLVQMSRDAHTQRWAREIGRRRGREIVLVAEHRDAGVVGFGSCGRLRGSPLPFQGEIYMLYVHPDHQNDGLGSRLLRGMFAALIARGVKSAVAWVLAENPSRFFYETMGGTRVAERDERLWNTVLHETAYGWTDLARWRAESPARRAR